MIRKLMICPYFGELPEWMDHFWANVDQNLRPQGYDVLVDTDEDAFRDRTREILGVEAPSMHGTGKVWDFRPTLGMLYEKELRGYDFWGHIDFDVVFGRVERWVTDHFLAGLDMHSNCESYVNGCWSLYHNTPQMASMFQEEPLWEQELSDPIPSGWAEKSFSRIVAANHDEGTIVKKWTQWQAFEERDLAELQLADDGRLLCRGKSIMMCHFRRTKVFPVGCRR